jgi:hypothetical protein
VLLNEADFNLLTGVLTGIFGTISKRARGQASLDERISRWACTVEPLNMATAPKGNSKQYSRWEIPQNPTGRLAYLIGLYASEEDCLAAKHRLLAQIIFMEDAPVDAGLFNYVADLRKRLLTYDSTLDQGVICPITHQPVTIADIKQALLQSSRIGRSELNVDYVAGAGNGNLLEPSNLRWIKPPYYLYALRKAVLDATQLDSLLEKIQTKSYLTDRRQTGDDAGNRVRRWEISPQDPQFAFYRECIRIEAKLLAQIFEMAGAPRAPFPEDTLNEIYVFTRSNATPGDLRCPVSGQIIGYHEFLEKVEKRVHGKSPYQVAHLTPLADVGGEGKHVVENISWITELGNRVQGYDSIEKIVEEIFAMATYHKNRLGLTWEEVEQRARVEKEKEINKIS